VREELSRLSCITGHNKVWVATTIFSGPERLPVLYALNDLHARGCDVRVIVARHADLDWVLANSDLPTGKVRLLDGGDLPGTHNKLLISNALYDGVERTAVYAGSHNLNRGSLQRSSDGMLRVTDEEVHGIYADYFMELFRLSRNPA